MNVSNTAANYGLNTSTTFPTGNYSLLYSNSYTTSFYTYAESNETRAYRLSPTTDQVLAILIPTFSLPGIFLNVVVLWTLFVKTCKLNKPTRQLHGHLVISNLILLIVCVPAISLVLYKGRIDYNNRTGRKKIVYELDKVFCNMSGFVFNVMMRMTIHISTTLAVDRVLAVQFPIFHKLKVQKYGYTWLLVIIWLFNLGTMATPFMVGKTYQQSPFECVCNWRIEYALFARLREKKHAEFLKGLVLLTYFFLPFTFTNILTIVCCVWVIALLLRKNLRIIVSKRRFGEKNSINGSHHYESLDCKPPMESRAYNGYPDETFKSNGHTPPSETINDEFTSSKILKATRSFKLPVVKLTHRQLKISDSKVKRACYTMLIVIVLQLLCYSVSQLMVVDQLLFYVFNTNYFSKHSLHNAVLAQLFINYPVYVLIFSISIPAVIHFRMTRTPRKNSARGLTTNHMQSSYSQVSGVRLNCPSSKKKGLQETPT